MSLGEDTGGSIRNPANNCGLVGLRPTWGLVSRYGMMGAGWSMDIGGPISRTAELYATTADRLICPPTGVCAETISQNGSSRPLAEDKHFFHALPNSPSRLSSRPTGPTRETGNSGIFS